MTPDEERERSPAWRKSVADWQAGWEKARQRKMTYAFVTREDFLTMRTGRTLELIELIERLLYERDTLRAEVEKLRAEKGQ